MLFGTPARPRSRVSLFALGFSAAALALGGACSSEDPKAPAAATADGGSTKTPEKPEDVPAVRLAAETSSCVGSYVESAPQEGLNKKYVIAGQSREFVLHLPPDSFTGPRPLFMGFNGTGESGPIFDERADLKEFAAAGFIVVVPSSAGNGSVWPVWDGMRTDKDQDNENKDLELFDSLLACTAAHYEVDKNRIYIAGHSAGGIFTNYVAQRRSEVLAGAIPASGIFSSTSPKPVPDMDKMLVIVTWGGDNDKFTGSVGGVSVPEANFVSEASVATKFYATQKNVGQVNCRGNRLNHVWLPINDWFIQVLLEHPKGLPGNEKIELPPVPTSKVTCTTDVFEFAGAEVTCGSSGTAGCQEACQLFADCAVENGTVASALKPQLTKIGFSGTDCGGCVTKCAAIDDADVLSCMKEQQAASGSQCGTGIEGAQPLMDAVNTCCAGKRTSSPYCKMVCDAIAENSIAIGYFEACQ